MALYNKHKKNLLLLCFFVSTLLILLTSSIQTFEYWLWFKNGIYLLLKNSFQKIFGEHLFNLVFWLILGFSLLFQRLYPAAPEQKIVNRGFFQDFVWFIYEPFFSVFIYGTYVLWAKQLYTEHLNFLTISSFLNQPDWLRFLVAILTLDFLNWFQHLLMHKIPWLWNLHSVHHSQTELNFFSSSRFHPLEFVIRNTFIVFPFFILDFNPPIVISYILFERWYVRFYHASIKSNLGPLKYIVVTPQSHRVHHSKKLRHVDKNFGALFSIWDYIFGTQYRSYDEYPATGISDKQFPLEKSADLKSLLITPFMQIIYCLQKMFPILNKSIIISKSRD